MHRSWLFPDGIFIALFYFTQQTARPAAKKEKAGAFAGLPHYIRGEAIITKAAS
jgi:hypothetical protein